MSKTVPFPDTFEEDYLFLTVHSKINESHMITTIPKIDNRQAKAARNSLIVAAFSSVLMVLPFYEGNPMSDLWGISFIALCSLITSLIVALMYNNHSKKMKSLLDQSELLAGWDMNGEMKDIYVAFMGNQWVLSIFHYPFSIHRERRLACFCWHYGFCLPDNSGCRIISPTLLYFAE